MLTLSHGQDAVERSFSLGNALLNYEVSKQAKKVLKSHILSNDLEPDPV